MKTELATQKNQSRGIIKIIALSDEGYRFNSFIHDPKELKQMLPTFVWSGEDIDRLEEWWSKRIEQLIAMKKPLAASRIVKRSRAIILVLEFTVEPGSLNPT